MALFYSQARRRMIKMSSEINHMRQELKSHVLAKVIKIVSEYDQENRQSQTADKPAASRGRATQQ